MVSTLRLLILGDVVGTPGVTLIAKHATRLKNFVGAHGLIVNGENSAENGRGITPATACKILEAGATVITGGNHSFQKKEMYDFYASHKNVLRPLNFPLACPGVGVWTGVIGGNTVSVINVQLRSFMREQLACPYRTVEEAISYLSSSRIIIIDMHGEATGEKRTFAHYFDGKISAIFGTHTHVQTADEMIFPKGTGYITDVGMVGTQYSIIGMQPEEIIYGALTQMPARFVVDERGPYRLCGIVVDIDTATGKSVAIKRILLHDTALTLDAIGTNGTIYYDESRTDFQ